MTIKTLFLGTLRFTLVGLILLILGTLSAALFVKLSIIPSLPSTAVLNDIRFQVPLRVYSADNNLMGEYGDQRRIPLSSADIPKMMKQAVLSIEDDRFYQHFGVDIKGVIRAGWHIIKTGKIEQGASTITMQLARNLFLTREKSFTRKLKEMLLAVQIEQQLSKEKILELYLNRIFFGHRAYGVAAAAQVYYGRDINALTIAEYAMIAGLPKAPSAYNPISNPTRALIRRNYILQRMRDFAFISDAEYKYAIAQPITAQKQRTPIELDAPYIGEMVRDAVVARYGEEAAYTSGYRVYTTVTSKLQNAAQQALRNALYAYDERHGYRGAVAQVNLPAGLTPEQLQVLVDKFSIVGPLIPAVVLEVDDEAKSVAIFQQREGALTLNWSQLKWAHRYINDNRVTYHPKVPSEFVKRGDIIMTRWHVPRPKKVKEGEEPPVAQWRLTQVPQAEGALISLRPDDGAMYALVGGFDFYHSKFNRVTQALRQPGSNFKPFVYSAALEYGLSPATVINDAPTMYQAGNQIWRPSNYGHRYYGPTSLRKALTLSRNLVAIRVIDEVGVEPTLNHVVKFGFPRAKIPQNLTMSLGTGEVTPLELVRGFSVFANGGYLVEPYLIERVEDLNGEIIYQANPVRVCRGQDCPAYATTVLEDFTLTEQTLTNASATADNLRFNPDQIIRYAPRVVRPQNTWLITSMLKDVISHGTGQRAKALNRSDLAGKTGTTNDSKDAWFSGFMPDIATTAWVGFDQPRSLGRRETGGKAALPMWIDYMRVALDDIKPRSHPRPAGLVNVRIDPSTGLRARPGQPNARVETFFSESVPTRYSPYFVDETLLPADENGNPTTPQTHSLF